MEAELQSLFKGFRGSGCKQVIRGSKVAWRPYVAAVAHLHPTSIALVVVFSILLAV